MRRNLKRNWALALDEQALVTINLRASGNLGLGELDVGQKANSDFINPQGIGGLVSRLKAAQDNPAFTR